MKKLIFIISFTVSFSSFAQRDSTSNNCHIIKITPSKIFGFANPGVTIGYERKINDKWSGEINDSSLFNKNVWSSVSSNLRISGYRISLEAKRHKFYFENGRYWAIELDYLNNRKDGY